MYPNSRYFGLYRYFGPKVLTIWVHGPMGFRGQSQVQDLEFALVTGG